jgi:hypothetical protein
MASLPGAVNYKCQVKKRKELDMGDTTITTGLVIGTKASCPECFRVFNLLNVDDADEYYFGHDCEVEE